jgi:hypothetical protein
MPLFLEDFGFVVGNNLTIVNGAYVTGQLTLNSGANVTGELRLNSGANVTGELRLNNATFAGSSTTVDSVTLNTLTITDDTIALAGRVTVSNGLVVTAGGATINGNLTVIGTTTTISSTSLELTDPVIDMGKGSVDAPDDLSRGMRFIYGTGASTSTNATNYNYGFLGWNGRDVTDPTAGELVFYTSGATGTNGNYSSGTLGNARFNDLALTGALTVGSGDGEGIIQSNGAKNLVLRTGGTASSQITIGDGANSNIYITPNGTGQVIIGGSGVAGVTGENSTVTTAIESGMSIAATALNLYSDTGTDIAGIAANAAVNLFTGLVNGPDGTTVNNTIEYQITQVNLTQVTTVQPGDPTKVTGFSGAQMAASKAFTISTADGYDLNLNAGAAVKMSSSKLLVGGTNIRDSMERVEIVPCDASVFGSTMAPLLMETAQYNGWNLNNQVQSSGTASWTIVLPSPIAYSTIEYITIDMKQLARNVDQALILKVSVDSSNYATYTFGDATKSVGVYQNYASLNGTGTPTGNCGHTPTATSDAVTTGTIINSSQIATISLENVATNILDVVINSIRIVTNADHGTLTYKFSNDSVRQAQSAQAVAALYAVLYNKIVSQTEANLLSANSLSGAGYNGSIGNSVYGSGNVLANYESSVLNYDNNAYTVSTTGSLNILAPTGTGAISATFGITPSLPTGLTLNVADGSITGTPTAVTADTVYTVTASKNGTTAKATFSVSTTLSIQYADYTSTSLAVNIPSPTGTVSSGVTYSVTSGTSLPSELTLNADGSIDGTVTTTLSAESYTVTARHTGTNTTADSTFTITTTPLGVSYSPSTLSVEGAGRSINFTAPTLTGVTDATYTSSDLPDGWLATDGSINGSSDGTVGSITYTITATKDGQTATTTVTVTITQTA